MDSNIILYSTDSGSVNVQVQYEDGTFWLTQKRMAELFGVDIRTISEHLTHIFDQEELNEKSVVRKIRITANDGKKYQTNFYHLDAIIAVGYRVNSRQATQFRIWATKKLNEFITKGYALSIDYDKDAQITRQFFATVQNKSHWAITGMTAAEIIYKTADASQLHMGLTTWRNAPEGKIQKSDVSIAKNYLSIKHISALNRLTSAYLDLAEDRAEQEIPTTMNDWAEILSGFLEVANRPNLDDAGSITALEAKIKAESEYNNFRKIQDYCFVSDFDKDVKRLEGE